MSKLIFLVLLGSMLLGPVVADEWLASSYGWLYQQESKDLVETSIQFNREAETGLLFLGSRDFTDKARIYLPDWSFGIIRKAMIKFLEWELVARKNKTILKKDLPDAAIKASVSWVLDRKNFQADKLVLQFQIVSKDAQNHYFAFTTNKVVSARDRSVSYELVPVYLSVAEVSTFLKNMPE